MLYGFFPDGTKPLLLTYFQSDPQEESSMNLNINTKISLQENSDHFVHDSMG